MPGAPIERHPSGAYVNIQIDVTSCLCHGSEARMNMWQRRHEHDGRW